VSYITLGVITIVLYLISILALFNLFKNPTSTNALYPAITAVLVLLFNIFSMIYVLVMQHNYWALITLISVVLQVSTFVIMHSLRNKLLSREQGNDDTDIESPIENSSTHTGNSDHGRSYGHSSKNYNPTAPPVAVPVLDIENPVHGGSKR
jgi:predicted membrane protein